MEKRYILRRCLHDLVDLQAVVSPEAVAVTDGSLEVSYSELRRRVNQLAHFLISAGVLPETRVGLCVERSADAVVGALGILAAGGAYVPLDPEYPRARLQYTLEDSGVPVVVTCEDVWRNAGLGGARPVLLDADRAAIGAHPEDLPDVAVSERNLAYLIYTSGSTGRPKGVAIEHRSAVSFLDWAGGQFERGELSAVLASTSLCFDLSVFELFAPLSVGGRVVIARNALHLRKLPAAGQVTLVNTVPSTMAELLRAGDLPPSVRVVNLAGEPLRSRLVRQIYAQGAVRKVYNLYGPSEDTTYSTAALIPVSAERHPSIGLPLPGTQAYVLGRDLQPAAGDEAGELFLGGAGLARGYLGRPELTAERFVPDPFAARPGERLYRTGDLVRRLPGGELDFLGRADQQVKLRGFRIELGEIEAVLAAHPGVADVAAAVRDAREGERRLVAWVEPAPGALLPASALRTWLAERLPAHMVPGTFSLLEALPRLPNGKIDRGALPEPSAGREGLSSFFEAPRTPLEARIAALWEELTGVAPVGVHDAFLEIGGHSLLAFQVAARLGADLGLDLPAHVCLRARTLADLARDVEARLVSGVAAAPISRVPRGDGLPLSFAQQRLWIAHRLEPGSAVYNIPEAMRLQGSLDAESLTRALEKVVERHEVLRTTFEMRGHEPVQVVAVRAGIPLPLSDLRGLPAEVREPEAVAAAQAVARRPFDLSTGPLLRAVLFRLDLDDHLLLIVIHHIAADGWSLDLLFRELSAFYAGQLLPELPVQYADYAVWQRRRLSAPESGLEGALARWRARLDGLPQLDLPADRPRPAVATRRGATHRFAIPREAARAARLGRSEGATPFMILLAAYEALLFRYTGQSDFAVGSPVAGRTLREVEKLIGFFVNLLPLRADLAGEPTGRALVRRVQASALEAYADQETPFDRLTEALLAERDASGRSVFQTVLALEETSIGQRALPGLRASRVDLEKGAAEFDLTLFLESDGDSGWRGAFEYRTDLIEAATVARLAQHFPRLLAALAEEPDRPVAGLPLFSEAELRHLLAGARVEGGDARPVHRQIEERAGTSPQAPAVVAGGMAVSYAELNRRANRLAHHLRRMGVGADWIVAVLADRSPEMVAGCLGVLKAGAAYLPIDPELPAERVGFMLRVAKAGAVLTQDRLLRRLPELSQPVISLDDSARFASERDDNPEETVDPDHLAYVIFTSGSTGEPKGVAVPHRGLANLVAWHRRAYRVSPADRATSAAGLSFDAAVWEIWPYLSAGASVSLVPDEIRLDPSRLLGWLAAERITLAFLPTPVAELALSLPSPEGLALRALLTGGDKLGRRGRAGRPFDLFNHYGPTENSVVATFAPVQAGDDAGLPPPIGRPIDNVRVCLVDAGLRLVPFGAPGEVVLGGEGLARGYLGRPDLTAERFIPDPWSVPGARLYRTGDLGRWRSSGDLEFLGRADRQVKVRGMRIELGEVEACLAGHPAVLQVLAGLRAGRLVAWLAGPELPPDGELAGWLRERLPAPMIPSAFIRLEALPLTANGKIDHRALPEPGPEPAPEAEAPRTETEELLLGIWRRVLDRRSVGRNDDFFVLGGHSLLAAQVISRIAEELGAELPLRCLFESPTVAGMAARVEAARAASGPAGMPPLVRRPPRMSARAPLSLTQQGLWFLSLLEPESSFYNIPSVLRLRGKLDVEALSWALSDVVARHEALRTALPVGEEGRPEQVIAPPLPVALPVVDLCSVPAAEREERCRERIAAEVRRSFDLARGPLLRALILRQDLQEHVLVLTVHHVIADGWSMGVLHRDLGAAYRARRRGAPPGLPELPIQYADYAVWQLECSEGGWIEPQAAFWKEWLVRDLPPLELPADRPRPAVRRHRGALCRTAVPAPLTDGLRELAGREAATLLMTLRAGFEILLFRYTGRESFIVGTPVAGRNRPELEDLVGFFVHMLPVPSDVAGEPGLRELLARVRSATLLAFDHQDVPFERLVEELRPAREEGRNPLFEILFAGNPPFTAPSLPGVAVERLAADTGTSKFELTLFVEERDGGVELVLEYDDERFEAATARRLIDHLLALLEEGVAAPGRSVADLPMLGEAERRLLLADWARVETAAPLGRRIPDLFEEVCAADPEVVALVTDEAAMTYAELNRRANRLAHRLRALGVGTDDPVGLCVERSIELVIGLLGILKAGGAYVPLDPSYPAERLGWMVEDARLSVIVGTAGPISELAVSGGGLRIVLLDGEAFDSQSEENPAPATHPDSLAYILFTSGSTGRPKGVSVPHRGVVRLVREAGFAEFSRDEVFLQYAPVPFDLSTLEIWGPLLNGARLVLPPPGRLSLQDLGAVLRRHQVTFLWLTAGLFHLMVDEQLDSLRGVRQLLAGGDVLSVPHVERALAALGERGGAVINGYGPTENTTFTSCHSMRGPAAFASSVPIGRPVSGTSVVVVDAGLRAVPQGVPGELLTGGHGLARGYFGRPDLTAERFVPDPFSNEPGARLYRTGDLARWLPGGTLEFLGRIDQQVKIRGFRVEPGEIETALSGHPAVRECVVVPRLVAGDRQLVAYLVTEGDPAAVAPGALREFLRERLPEPLIPAAFVVLPDLPLSPNGKVDRRALPDPGVRISEEGIGLEAPRTAVELVVADVWAEVLELDAVGVHDDFFALGGHSLKAAQLVSRLQQVLRVEIPLRALLRRPTVAGLAGELIEDPARKARVERIAELLVGLPEEEEMDGEEAEETESRPDGNHAVIQISR